MPQGVFYEAYGFGKVTSVAQKGGLIALFLKLV